MPLKTLVKTGNITNLSDARYCAGMGVDLLGFNVIEGQTSYISPKLFQEIRGWVAGPQVVAEIYGISGDTDIKRIIQEYQPDFLELYYHEYKRHVSELPLPLILSVQGEEISYLKEHHPGVSFWIVNEGIAFTIKGKPSAQILVRISSRDPLPELLSNKIVSGVVLNGSAEIRPGYKNYDDIADILEFLEEYSD
jgi:phosphoribosylanthranilate isomerase